MSETPSTGGEVIKTEKLQAFEALKEKRALLESWLNSLDEGDDKIRELYTRTLELFDEKLEELSGGPQ